MYNTEKFQSKLNAIGISLNDEQMKQFLTYYEMLVERNKVMNLTAITDFDEVIDKHFVDSLSMINYAGLKLNPASTYKIIDVGTGAGFPGIPLKIAFPELKVTLMDSLNKRINFLNDVIQMLGLRNIKAVHSRAEDLGRNVSYRQQFDICTSRAVANLSTLSEYCLPFVKKGGYFIPYKSGQIEDEVKQAERAIKLLGGKSKDIISYQLPDTDIDRTLLVIEKIKDTGKAYPRKAGKPSKEPL